MSPNLPQPTWTLSGTVVDWPDGQLAPLRQGPWMATAEGWTMVISISRSHEGGISYHTMFVTIVADGVPEHVERAQAQALLTLRLRSLGPNPPVHLGSIVVGS